MENQIEILVLVTLLIVNLTISFYLSIKLRNAGVRISALSKSWEYAENQLTKEKELSEARKNALLEANNSLMSMSAKSNSKDMLIKELQERLDDRYSSFLSPTRKIINLINIELGYNYSIRKVNDLIKSFNNFDKALSIVTKEIITKKEVRENFMRYVQSLESTKNANS